MITQEGKKGCGLAAVILAAGLAAGIDSEEAGVKRRYFFEQ